MATDNLAATANNRVSQIQRPTASPAAGTCISLTAEEFNDIVRFVRDNYEQNRGLNHSESRPLNPSLAGLLQQTANLQDPPQIAITEIKTGIEIDSAGQSVAAFEIVAPGLRGLFFALATITDGETQKHAVYVYQQQRSIEP